MYKGDGGCIPILCSESLGCEVISVSDNVVWNRGEIGSSCDSRLPHVILSYLIM